MPKILSNREYVRNKIEDIKSILIPLNRDFKLNQDLETNLLGNTKSHKLNDDFNSSINQFISFLERDLKNVENIAENFETIDKSISSKIIE